MNTNNGLAERRDFLARCTRCSQCKFVPAVKSQRHASACPSMDYGQFHAFSGGGQLIMSYGLLSGDIQYSGELLEAVSSCTMCGNCDISCKVNFAETVEPLDSLYALRLKIVADGHSPPEHAQLVNNMRATGNAQGHPRANRCQWADGLDLEISSIVKPDVLLHIGSQLSYDQSRWDALRSVVKVLQDSGIVMAHLGNDEQSSGGLSFDLGYVDDSRSFAKRMVEQVVHSGATTLVTFSAAALAAFRAIYPRLGHPIQGIRVLHYSEYIHELVQNNRLSIRSRPNWYGEQVAYHDSCKLGRLSETWSPHDIQLDNHMGGILTSRAPQALRFGQGGCYDAPRKLLSLLGFQVVELERNHASSYCCGAGGGVPQTLPLAASLAAANRLAEVNEAQTSTLISGCSSCSSHLGKNASDEIHVRDLIDLLAEALGPVTSSGSLRTQ